MTTVSVSELKAHLSRYLREVRRGGEVQVLDRGVPVAVLRPVTRDDEEMDDRRDRMIRAGVIRPGSTEFDPLGSAPLKIGTSLLESLEDEREDRF
ncbi:MAG: type II toxin-antitoxin system prevent-host-death family antitoxin [Thermoanaerobaculia bacterium]|nr:type II toxin-antitoxin system prevent-host-death family antitoxin [Thermoanaerobaculia bacterium]